MKANISQEWIDNTDLRTILDKAFMVKQNNLINSAREWLARELMDIESKAKRLDNGEEREGAALILEIRSLEEAKFGVRLKDYIQGIKNDRKDNTAF